MYRKLCNQEISQPPDYVAVKVAGVDSVGKVFTQLELERHNVITATQLQQVDGLFVLCQRSYGYVWRDVPDRQGNVGIDRIRVVGDHQLCLCHLQRFIGGLVLDFSRHHGYAVDVKLHCFHRVRLDHEVGDVVKLQARQQRRGQAVEAAQNDMALCAGRDCPGRMKPHSGFHPRCVEESDEYERQYDQKQYNAGQKNHDTE